MDFAKRQLEKYGWKEGKGLGKLETGISDALKPKPKRGSHGIGFNIAEEFTNEWWHNVYNDAASKISVCSEKNGDVCLALRKTKKSKKSEESKKVRNLPYSRTFIKTATLQNGHTESVIDEREPIIGKISKNRLSDEELFAACGGRTAHKGARHGLRSNGKLSRLRAQESIDDLGQRRIKTTHISTVKNSVVK